MIRYQLSCEMEHGFESWFRDSAAYEDQRKRELVACPTCGSTQVEKAIMAPSVARTDRAATDAVPASTQPVALMSEPEQKLRAMLKEMRDHVTRNADYVGEDFADLARQMHDGEVEQRSIYGEASAEDVKALRDDDVEVYPLPVLPDERN